MCPLLALMAALFHGRRALVIWASLWSMVSSGVFKCSLPRAEIQFLTCNQHFRKVGHISSKEVVLQLVESKRLPPLLYCLEVWPLTKMI